jgi:CDGSH-type Zn-finger protein
VITPYRDGPLLVRGDFRMIDAAGLEIDPGRRTIALCRCGRSGRRPFCDGSQWAVGFRSPGGDERGDAGNVAAERAGAVCGDGEPLAGVADPSEQEPLAHG